MLLPRLAGMILALTLLAAVGVAAAAPQTAPDAADALGLKTAWELTQKHYPRYQAAVSGREAGLVNRALGRAPMLPHVSARFKRTQNWGELTQPGPRGDEISTELDYVGKKNRIKLTQTVFDWGEINAWQKGYAEAERALAVFDNKVSGIAMQLIERYLQVLLAQQDVALAQKNLKAAERHVDIARNLYKGGEGTITDVREAEAQRARAYAELQKAQSSLAIAQRKLQAMTGRPSPLVQDLGPVFKIHPLQPSSLSAWIARAQENNAAIDVARKTVQIAAQRVDKAIGNVLPSVELVASYSRNDSQSISLRGVESETTSVGIRVNVPIYAGGKNWAQIEQARYKYQRSRQKLAATRQRVAVKVTRQYLNVVSGAERIEALEKAVRTAKQALKAVRKSYQAGTRSISDILEAQQQLYQVRRNLVRARLSYVKARIKLKMIASSLSTEAVVMAASRWFGPAPIKQK